MEQKRCQFCRKPVRRNDDLLVFPKLSTEVFIRNRHLVIQNVAGVYEKTEIKYCPKCGAKMPPNPIDQLIDEYGRHM
jgi:hypothetical protein